MQKPIGSLWKLISRCTISTRYKLITLPEITAMDFQSKPLRLFLLSVVLIIAVQASYANAQSQEVDSDAVDQFIEDIEGLASSIVSISSNLESGVTEGEADISDLTDMSYSMGFQVQMMRLEQDAEVLSGKRTANSAEKEQGIAEAEQNLTSILTPKLLEVAENLTQLNTTLHQTTFGNEDLAALQAMVNANLTEDEQIVIPTASDMMSNVTAEIEKVKPIFERRATTEQLVIINNQLDSIRENFQRVFSAAESTSNDHQGIALISRQISASLAQISQLHVFNGPTRVDL